MGRIFRGVKAVISERGILFLLTGLRFSNSASWIPHLVFWFYHSLWALIVSRNSPFDEAALRFIVVTCLNMAVFYAVYGSLHSNPFKNPGSPRYYIPVMLILAIIMFARYRYELGINSAFRVPDKITPPVRHAIFVVFPVVLMSAFAIFIRYLDNKLLQERLFTDSKSHSLTNRIQPQFLLKTVQNIQLLYVLEFSNFLKYILYDAEKPRIPLSREIEAMNHFIHLFRLKSEEALQITFKVEGEDFFSEAKITPLLGIYLLENAFKYSGLLEHRAAWIEAIITCDGKNIGISVSNSCLEDPTAQNYPHAKENHQLHVQLHNNYRGKYRLEVIKKPETNFVFLEIPC